MVNNKSNHGFFLDAEVLFDLLCDPGANDSLDYGLFIKILILDRERIDFSLIFRKTHIDFFVFHQNFHFKFFSGFFALGGFNCVLGVVRIRASFIFRGRTA